jgi:uncharacterized protein (TIGR02266 family)
MKKNATAAKKDDGRTAGERIPIELLVDYKAQGSYLFDFCRDLGSGGVFIETSTPRSIGEELELTFTIPDSKETVTTRGRVIWVQSFLEAVKQPSGMGVQFIDFSKENKGLLEDFVKRYAMLQSA